MAIAGFGDTQLLLHFDTAGGLTDLSIAARTFTAVGGAAVTSADSKFGDGSLNIPFNSGIYTPWSDQAFGVDNFTVELFVKTTAAYKHIVDAWGAQTGWMLMVSTPGCISWVQNGVIKNGAITINDGAWHHVAVSRVSGLLYFFVDGVQDGDPVANTANLTGADQLYIGYRGSYPSAELDFTGKIDELRITKNVGRYNATFPAPTAAFALDPAISSSLTCPMAKVTMFSGGMARLNPSPPTLASSAGGYARLVGTFPSLMANAHDSTGELSAALTAPSPRLASQGGGYAILAPSKQRLASTGITGISASLVALTPSPALSATGTTTSTASADLSITTLYSLVGYSGAVCSVTLTGSPTLQASGTTVGIGGAALSCPLFELTATATAQNHGGADLLAPSPRMGKTAQAWLAAPGARLSAIGSAVVTATYEAYAINLKHTPRPGNDPVDEATRYTNFPFTHVIRHKGSYYGANNTGLYLLEGTTDDAVPITWAVKTAMTDFDSPLRKTVVSAYFAGRLGSQTTIDLHVGEDGTKTYTHTTPRGEHAQSHRQKFGRGTDARYYALGASGSGAIELDSIELMVQTSKRRI